MLAEPEGYAKRLHARRVGLPPQRPQRHWRASACDLNSKQHPPARHDFRPTLALAKQSNVTK
ncbi:hypothetical protein NX08_005215 [Xanthomonas vasicola]|nr:hypothetical protein NX08_005215 [Xanthomonas vasicola]